VTNAGHMVAGDRNDIFGNSVMGFLARTVPVAGVPVHPSHAGAARRVEPGAELNDVP